MNTLLLRLAGPMQSWGVQSRFSVRETGLEPSKSGVIGLLCAALGRGREEAIDDLAALRMGVRADQEGVLSRDYHVAQDVLKAGGGIKDTEPSVRYYLADAVFLVGLESDHVEVLQEIQNALRKPTWPLYLGRKAFLASEQIHLADGIQQETTLEEALTTYPYLISGARKDEAPERLRVLIERSDGEAVRPDQPVSFSPRRYHQRRVHTLYVSTPPAKLEVS